MSIEDRFRKNEGQWEDEEWKEDEQPFPLWPLLTSLGIMAVIIAAMLLPVYAGEPEGNYGEGHALYHQFYSKMHNQNGTHCCNDGDCRPTTARWNHQENQWEAKVDGHWQKIAKSRHVTDAYGLTEFASVCADPTGYIFCFIPPNTGF